MKNFLWSTFVVGLVVFAVMLLGVGGVLLYPIAPRVFGWTIVLSLGIPGVLIVLYILVGDGKKGQQQ